MSSRMKSSSPDVENIPAACKPPVDSKVPCAARSLPGAPRIASSETATRPLMGGESVKIASSVALPQSPQDEPVKRWRVRRPRSTATPSARNISTRFSSVRGSIFRSSERFEMIPSVSRKPAASSSSSPGVRISTATGWPSSRISKGSSTATRSLAGCGPPGPQRLSEIVFEASIPGSVADPPLAATLDRRRFQTPRIGRIPRTCKNPNRVIF